MAARRKLTKRKLDRFLIVLSQKANVTEACEAIGVSNQALYEYKKEHPTFASKWVSTVDQALDKLEQEAWRRASDGVDKPVHYKGERVDTIREYSDALLMFLLRGHRPNIYRERPSEAPPTADKPVLNVIETARQVCLTLEVAKQLMERQEPDPVVLEYDGDGTHPGKAGSRHCGAKTGKNSPLLLCIASKL